MSDTGVTLSPEELFDLARDAGFDPLEAKDAVAIALVESNGETRAFNPEGPHGGAVGLWQIAGVTKQWLYNNVDGFDSEEDLYTPEKNAKAAYMMAHHLNGWSEPLEKADWDDWRTSLSNSEKFTLWHPRDDNEETAMAAATRVFHDWAGDDSDVLYPEDVGGFGEPGSLESTTPAADLKRNLLGFDPSFNKRIESAMRDEYGPNFLPVKGRISKRDMAVLSRNLRDSDPGLAEVLNDPNIDFAGGRAAIVGYATDEDAARAQKSFRQHGLVAHPSAPFVLTPLGGQSIDKSGDVASQMWDAAIGSLWDDPDNRPI